MDLSNIGYEVVDWIHVDEDRLHKWTLEHCDELSSSIKTRNFLTI
jgi:hypothetical protein